MDESNSRQEQDEEQFAKLVANVRDYAVFILDRTGRIATWNAGAERIKGYRAEEIIGEHFSRFYPSEALAARRPEHVLEVASTTGRFEEEGWRLRKDGSRFWASVVVTALHDDSSRVRGFLKITRDLTERREAEERSRRLIEEEAARAAAEEAALEIEKQREQLHVTLASIGDAVMVTNERGIVTFMNPVAEQLTGYGLAEIAGRPLNGVLHIVNEQTRQPVSNPIEMVIRENRIVELANHTVLIAKDGHEIPIEDSAAPIRARDGSVSGAVLVFRDVTEARRASEARRYLAAIVESSDDAIIGQTLDGKIASWNRGAERLYGYRADEVVGQPLAKLVPPDHPDEVPALLDRIKRGEFIEHFETERVRKDGTRVAVSLTISAVHDAEGNVIGASKIARDITARREEDRRKSEFLALLAHELRNPLAPLRNGLQVMRLAKDDREVMERTRVLMERQLQHMVRLVDDLLDISRISQGKLQLRKERITLTEAVQHALELCKQAVREQAHEVVVSLPDELLTIEADKTRIAQAVCNLLHNAAKYSEKGKRIEISAGREGNQAVTRVKDYGIGIARSLLPQVFDMFVQADRSLERSQGGLGVGLAIVKRVIEMHGGSVEAHSAGPGEGSEFVIRLPLVSAAAKSPSSGASAAARDASAVRRRVLVVDDNIDGAQSLSLILAMMGHDVRTEHDGESGYEQAAAFRPDVIFLDLGMPKQNGFHVAEAIRKTQWGQAVTLIALTGWGQEEDRRRSKEAGFDHHLVKPIDPATIERLL